LLRLPELREIAAVEDEVGLRIERVHVVDRAQELAHEAVVQLALVEVRVGDVREGERLAFPGRRVRHRHRDERVRVEERAAAERGAGGGERHLEEAPAIEPRDVAEERLALGVVAGLDARVARHGYLPPLGSPLAAARSSNGRTRRIASSSSRNGRCVRAPSRRAALCLSFSPFSRSSPLVKSSATTASTSSSLSASGSMPPSR